MTTEAFNIRSYSSHIPMWVQVTRRTSTRLCGARARVAFEPSATSQQLFVLVRVLELVRVEHGLARDAQQRGRKRGERGGTKKNWWPLGGTKGWMSDAGWGCMLRPGQSPLASAPSRAGKLDTLPTPHSPPPTAHVHALHTHLLSWFLDTPASPFSVRRITLVDPFPAAVLGVSVATDSTLYQTVVFAASHSLRHPRVSRLPKPRRWAGTPPRAMASRPMRSRASDIRLGLDGVNPVYYETIKLLYTFPQSVGIAGDRPSSGTASSTSTRTAPRRAHPDSFPAGSPAPSPVSSRAGSMSPEFMHVNINANTRVRSMSADANAPMTEDERTLNTNTGPDSNTSGMSRSEEAHYARAYSTAELRTFHCERVRKMPLSGLDTSMLVGFVCRDEAEWVDLRRRVGEVLAYWANVVFKSTMHRVINRSGADRYSVALFFGVDNDVILEAL
ncbi:hypothetical protein B0H10DRAFT_1944707 [Mycena sp. CBHHK59/15]|nr:hypothetical protein B0H10DRAFT_1944707 [Mycena sp. CBHHK59/15]